MRFIRNCRSHASTSPESDVSQAGAVHLTTSELIGAEKYWIRFSQEECFSSTIVVLQMNGLMRKGDSLISLHPFNIDSDNLLRVGGREGHSNISKSKMHPIILHGKHTVTKLITRQEHIRLLHAGPTLLSSSLSRRFSIVGLRRTVRSITRWCVICRQPDPNHRCLDSFLLSAYHTRFGIREGWGRLCWPPLCKEWYGA